MNNDILEEKSKTTTQTKKKHPTCQIQQTFYIYNIRFRALKPASENKKISGKCDTDSSVG